MHHILRNMYHVLESKNNTKNVQEECVIKTQTDRQKTTFCDKHRATVAKTGCLEITQTVCERHIMSVIDIFFLWQTTTICDRHKLSVTEKI